MYDLFKRTLLSGPVYATLGNHDSYSQYVSVHHGVYVCDIDVFSLERRVHPTLWTIPAQINIAGMIYTIRAFHLLTHPVFRNYDHVAALWEHEGWLEESITREAKTHYAAYSVQRSDGLRVISLNTNLCMSLNFFLNQRTSLMVSCRVHVSPQRIDLLLCMDLTSTIQGKLLQLHQYDQPRCVRHVEDVD